MLCYLLTGLAYSSAVYITGLTIDFFTVVFGYMIVLELIMQQPLEVSDRPAPQELRVLNCKPPKGDLGRVAIQALANKD